MKRQDLNGWMIDGHVHCYGYTPGRVKRWADATHVAGYVLASLPCDVADDNDICLRVKQEDPDRAYFFAGLEHPCSDYAANFKSWLEKGADGLKLLETKPTEAVGIGVNPADESFDALFALCEEQRIPIVWHVGDPATFWDPEKVPDWAVKEGWYYGDGRYPTLQELYARAETVLARHPGLNVCFAHLYFCSDDMAHAQRLLDTYPNVRLDITPGSEMYTAFFADREAWRDFFIRNARRIQLGSDVAFDPEGNEPDNSPQDLATTALLDEHVTAGGFDDRGLDLPEEVVRLICRENFKAFMGKYLKPHHA